MSVNCLAPGYVKINYTSRAHPHVMVIPVKPDGSGIAMHVLEKNGSSVLWSTAVGTLVALLVPLFHTDDTFDTAEIYTQADCTSAPVFQDNTTLGVAGTNSVSLDYAYQQFCLSFRTVGGGRAFIKLMEGNWYGNDMKVPYGSLQPAPKALADYMTGNTSINYARDNTYLSACLNGVTKVNDELRRKYLSP